MKYEITVVQCMCVYLNKKIKHLQVRYSGTQNLDTDSGSGMELNLSLN